MCILKGKGGIFNYKHGVTPIVHINFKSGHEISAITDSNKPVFDDLASFSQHIEKITDKF